MRRKGFGVFPNACRGRIMKAAGEGATTPCDPALTPDSAGGPVVTIAVNPESHHPDVSRD